MKDKEKNFISAVVYVHNAEKRIGVFLKAVVDVLEENFEKSEIICVNDFSEDESISIIKKVNINAKQITVSILNMSYFHGLEAAMNAGTDLAIGDFVLEFDSPVLDFHKEDIMKVYRKSLDGYDIVSASPDAKQKLTSSLFYHIFDKYTNISYKLYTERFRILSRRVINRVSSMNKSVPYRKAVYANCGLKTLNLQYEANRSALDGVDRLERKYRKNLAIDTLILFTGVGYSFSVTMTIVMMTITVIVAIYSAMIYFTSTPIEGWTTTILFLAFAFFGLFGILTIIIKYLQILIDLVFRRKKYSFESIEKLTR